MRTLPYTMSARDLVTNDCDIHVTFHGDLEYTGKLSGIKAWASVHNPGVMRQCASDGMRHGLFPCIVALDERMAAALSADYGQKVAMGDGRSFFTRRDLLACKAVLERAGVHVPNRACVWAISSVPYGPEQSKPEATKSQQPSYEEQLLDCPF